VPDERSHAARRALRALHCASVIEIAARSFLERIVSQRELYAENLGLADLACVLLAHARWQRELRQPVAAILGHERYRAVHRLSLWCRLLLRPALCACALGLLAHSLRSL
jgi:hypothetical protein